MNIKNYLKLLVGQNPSNFKQCLTDVSLLKNIYKLFSNQTTRTPKETVVKLWMGLGISYHLINADPEENENHVLDVSEKSKELIELFCFLGGTRVGYNKLRVTSYMHALSNHVPVFIKNHKTFKQFTGQGVDFFSKVK